MASPAVAVTVETQQPPAPKLDNVLYEKRSGIAYVTLNRPKVLNALNTPTWKDLRTAFEDARDDAPVRMTPCTAASSCASSKAVRKSFQVGVLSALSTFGRLSVT